MQYSTDNYQLCRLINLIQNRDNLTDESLADISAIVGDDEKAQQILTAAKMSSGTDISEIDLVCMGSFPLDDRTRDANELGS